MITGKVWKNDMKVVITAGGKGTRISSINSSIPKPMIELQGKPVLLHQIETLKKHGFVDIILTVGYMSEKIVNYFGDGSKFGVHIEYFVETEPLGNAGALYFIKDWLSDDFLLINGDIIFDIDFSRFLEFHFKKGGDATIFVHPNSHPYDSGLVVVNENCNVINWFSTKEERPIWYKNLVNAGIHLIKKSALGIKDTKKVDLDNDVLKPLISKNSIYAYKSPEYVKDMGTPDRYLSVSKDIFKKIPHKKSLANKQKAIFLDRDGTINKFVGFLTNVTDFALLDYVSEAISMINNSVFLSIVATNQPVVARGEVSLDYLHLIHNKMETLLGYNGAFVDAIYFCPHHPHNGYDGEIKELKIDCYCRKPKPGMLIKASDDFNLDLNESWIIGDSYNDIIAGQSIGCKTILIRNNRLESSSLITPNYVVNNLLEAVKIVLENENGTDIRFNDK